MQRKRKADNRDLARSWRICYLWPLLGRSLSNYPSQPNLGLLAVEGFSSRGLHGDGQLSVKITLFSPVLLLRLLGEAATSLGQTIAIRCFHPPTRTASCCSAGQDTTYPQKSKLKKKLFVTMLTNTFQLYHLLVLDRPLLK